jgi:hypothetical protein
MMPFILGYGPLVSISLWVVLGLFLGVGLVIALAGTSDGINNMLLKQILRSNKDGWALVQRGNSYSLEKMERDPDANAWTIDGEDGEDHFVTDPADQVHSFFGVPFGLKLGGKRPLVDVQTAAAAEGASEQVTDGGRLVAEDEMTLQQMQDRLGIGELQLPDRGVVVKYINPFVELPRDRLVDIREVTQLFRYEGGSDVPRKAAKNAVEAEQALESGYGDLKEFGKVLAAFIAGAVAAFIGSSGGGGGGGGGGLNVGLLIDLSGVVF